MNPDELANLVNMLNDLPQTINTGVSGALGAVTDGVVGGLGQVGGAASTINTAIEGAGGTAGSQITNVTTQANGAISGASGTATGLITGPLAEAADMLDSGADLITGAAEAINGVPTVIGAIPGYVDTISNSLNTITGSATTITDSANTIVETGAGVVNSVLGTIPTILNTGTTVAGTATAVAGTGANVAVGTGSSVVGQIINTGSGAVTQSIGSVTATTPALIGSGNGVLTQAIGQDGVIFGSAIPIIPQLLTSASALTMALSNTFDVITNAIDALTSVEDAFSPLATSTQQLIDNTNGALGDLEESLNNVNILDLLSDNIELVLGSLIENGTSIFELLTAEETFSPAIEGLTGLGGEFLGFAEDLRESAGLLSDSLTSVFNTFRDILVPDANAPELPLGEFPDLAPPAPVTDLLPTDDGLDLGDLLSLAELLSGLGSLSGLTELLSDGQDGDEEQDGEDGEGGDQPENPDDQPGDQDPTPDEDPDDDHSDTPDETATELTLDAAERGILNDNGDPNDRDVFKINVVDGQKYIISINNFDDAEIENGSETIFASVTNASGNPNDLGRNELGVNNFAFIADGDGFAYISLGDGQDIENTYSITAIEADNDDHGDTLDVNDSTELSLDVVENGVLEIEGDRDVFHLNVVEGKKYTVTLNNIDDGLSSDGIVLTSPKNTTLIADNSNLREQSITFTAKENGIIYFEARNDREGSSFEDPRENNSYSLKINEAIFDDDHGDSPNIEDATEVKLGDEVDGIIELNGDRDFFYTEVVEGREYTAELIFIETEARIGVTNASGDFVGSANSVFDNSAKITFVADESGMAYFNVENVFASRGGPDDNFYTVTIYETFM